MWRIPGLLTRALNRFHASGVPGYVHGETEALSPSSLLPLGQNASNKSYTYSSSSSKNGQNGQDQKKKGTFQSFNGQLPQYTILDAFGWGAAAVFFLQLARQISLHNSTPNSPKEGRCSRRSCLDQIIASLEQTRNPFLRTYIVPKRTHLHAWNELHLQGENKAEDEETSPESFSSASSSESGVLHLTNEQCGSQIGNTSEFSITNSSTCGSDTESDKSAERPGQEVLVPEEDLGESLPLAASRLLDVVESSVPVVLNITGIVSARDRADYSTAFRFFLQSAECGYSKAQYNTGVCYEQGKGVGKDMKKAAAYYLLAAQSGHNQAKYRYARYLLHRQAESKPEIDKMAVQMLQEAAEAGLKEAQAYLGVLYSKESHMNPQKAVRYLWMAAENGDGQSRYYLGVCYERGFGVPASRREALRHYERAAKTGYSPAQQKLLEMRQEEVEGLGSLTVSLRAAASSPCLPVLERERILTGASHTHSANTNSLGLPHSLSTGNLLMVPADTGYSLAPLHVKRVVLPLASLRVVEVG
ncbi:death ligand signal enhancer [Rhinophrynus dorsalis]